MKLALEALEVATTPFARDRQEVLRAQAALREALAKPDFWEGYVPEPVKPATEESSATQAQQALDKKAENARELGLDYEPAQPYKGIADHINQATNGGMRIDPVTGDVGIGTPSTPAQQEPVAWKLVPTEPTEEMLKAMDECSKEGYDERLYAGHAASVYMAAVDAAPTPPAQKEPFGYFKAMPFGWTDCAETDEGAVALYERPPAQRKPLTDEEIEDIWADCPADWDDKINVLTLARAIEAAHGIKGEA